MKAVALIDGEHSPAVVRDALAGLPYEKLVPAEQKANTTIDVPIVELDL